VGDSRVLRFAGGYVRQLTPDHTPVGSQVFEGTLSEEAAAAHPDAARLTRSLGLVGDSEVELQCGLDWAPGDAFILCTDGVHALDHGLSRQRIQEIMREDGPLPARAQRMVDEAAASEHADNSTIVLVEISAAAPGEAG
jgi:PPM family protein phosphatase